MSPAHFFVPLLCRCCAPQVKELQTASAAAEDRYRTTIAAQAAQLVGLHDYIDAKAAMYVQPTHTPPDQPIAVPSLCYA